MSRREHDLSDDDFAAALASRLNRRTDGEGITELNDLGKAHPLACPLCQVVGAHQHPMYQVPFGNHRELREQERKRKFPPSNIAHEIGPTGLVEARGAGPFAGMRARWRGPGDPETLFSEGCDDNFARAVQKYRVLWGV